MTGTPGTGKSTVAVLLAPRYRVREVSELALSTGAGRRRGRTVVVDLPLLARFLQRALPATLPELLVGHVAHLLPVKEAILLRCRPIELDRRLRRARRGGAASRRANVESEVTDVILVEALERGLRVYEIDTTDRTPLAVAREVERRLRTGGPARFGSIRWLLDPEVTEHLLDRPT